LNQQIRIGLILAGGAALIAIGVLSFVVRPHPKSEGDPARGKALAQEYCARCHAIEPGKESPVADAPPFSTFAQHWPLENLEEALAEGIMVGHDKFQMPVFQFDPDQIADLIAYLKTIQVPAPTEPVPDAGVPGAAAPQAPPPAAATNGHR
jgi:mono/diheme cytochrome c family protein